MSLSGTQITAVGVIGFPGRAYAGFTAKAEQAAGRSQIQDFMFTAYYPPQQYDDYQIYEQFRQVQTQFESGTLSHIKLATTYSEPDKPDKGEVYYADGTQWNPGSGEGYYGYYASAWHKLG